MQPLICCKFIDQYLLVDRFNNIGVRIEKVLYEKLTEILYKNRGGSSVPEPIKLILYELGYKENNYHSLKELILIRDHTNFSFGRVSYEITEQCNYQCQHCYLGKKSSDSLNKEDKKRILKLIERSGCLWL